MVRRKLHNQGSRFIPKEEFLKNPRYDDGQNDTDEIKAEDHKSLVPLEKDSREQDIDRETGGTGHEGKDQNREGSILFRLKDAASHDRRHIAPNPRIMGRKDFP